MLLELSQLPQIVQEQILTAKANDIIQIVNNGELVKTAQFNEVRVEELYFDIEQMKIALGETDENGRAKNTVEIPKGLAKDFNAFHQWMLERRSCK